MKDIKTYLQNVFVINMDKDTERLNKISTQLSILGIDFTRFSAVDGSKVKSHPKLSKLCSSLCTNGIKGCGLSHMLLWKQIIDNNLDYALILEDDAEFESNFNHEFIDFYNKVPKDYDILQLGCVFGCDTKNNSAIAHEAEKILNIEPYKFTNYNKLKLVSGTHAYIISNKGATTLYNNLTLTTHLDIAITIYAHKYGLNIYSPKYDLIVQQCVASQSSLTSKFPGLLLYQLDKINLFQKGKKNVSVGWILSESLAKIISFDINGIFIILVALAILSNFNIVIKLVLIIWLLIEIIHSNGTGIQYLILFLLLSNINNIYNLCNSMFKHNNII